MSSQTFDLGSRATGHREVVVETPLGFMVVRWAKQGKKVEIELPEGLTAHLGMARAVQAAVFVEPGDSGPRPKYNFLIPRLNPGGDLAGVKVLQRLVIGAQK